MSLRWESEHSILTPSPIRFSQLPRTFLPPCFLHPEEVEAVVVALEEAVPQGEGSEAGAVEAGEEIHFHCPWPFQDGSLSRTLEQRASQVGSPFVGVSTRVYCHWITRIWL